MKYCTVIDTNVLVSALISKLSDSATVIIIEKVFSGDVIPVFCKEMLDEYYSVLKRKKFGLNAETIDTFLQEFQQRGILMEAMQTDIILEDMKDVPFYAVTLACGEDKTYLVTGNLKHFPAKPFIVSPARFLEIMQGAD